MRQRRLAVRVGMAVIGLSISGCLVPPAMVTEKAESREKKVYADPATINETGFEGYPDETEYLESLWVKDGFYPRWVEGFDKKRAHVDTAHARSGTASLRILYPANTFGPDVNGAQAPLAFAGRSEVTVTYWLRFSEDFDWGGADEGGKLPGLGSGDNCSGGKACDGFNGFSARLMWRTGGKAVLYLYHMDKPAKWGEDMDLVGSGGEIYFKKGEWIQVMERVKINTGTNHDAEVQVWINGEEALLKKGLQLVSDGSLIDNFYFSTFHGGGEPTWSPEVDSFIWFDDIRVSKTAPVPTIVQTPTANNSYRNVALNPDDRHMETWSPENGYPHVTTNNEYPNNPDRLSEFYALNVIDGNTVNAGHGPEFPSWGPNHQENIPHNRDPWLKIDFGTAKKVDQLVIWIRADFPHDSYWKEASVRFEDNSVMKIALKPTAEPQTFPITPARTTSHITFESLVQNEPEWCGFTEVQVWGTDAAESQSP